MKRFIETVIVFMMVSTIAAFANDAPVKSVGKTVRPLKDVPVRMVSEKVDISLSEDHALVHCSFTLKNEGKPDTIEVGFPRGWESDLLNFEAKIEKTLLPVKTLAQEPSYNEILGGELPWWKVFRVLFDSTGETVVVENSYRTDLQIFGGGYPSSTNDLLFTYIMKTGALWQGNIEDALITIQLDTVPPEQVTAVYPKGYTREGNRIVWHFRDFKPVEDIRITIMRNVSFERLVRAKKMLKTVPKNAYAHYLLGSVSFSRRNVDNAETDNAAEEARKAISLDPKLWDAHWLLTLAYIHKNVMDVAQGKPKNREEINNLLDPILRGNPGYRCTDKLIYYEEYASYDNPRDLMEFLVMNRKK